VKLSKEIQKAECILFSRRTCEAAGNGMEDIGLTGPGVVSALCGRAY
jgi:hypothetical protein